MRILVCGGRDYTHYDKVHEYLGHFKPSVVIAGCAPGADTAAEVWARINNVEACLFLAEWGRYGRRAGPLRNQKMLDEGKPDLVLAFPGGNGTADMVRRAREADIQVIEVPV